MNDLYLIVPSSMKVTEDIKRLITSIDVSKQIHVIFINQSEDGVRLNDVINIEKLDLVEIFTYGLVPLAVARNKGLEYLHKVESIEDNSFIMFVDDDAWFPKETIDYLLSAEIRAFSLKTIDPDLNKAFNKSSQMNGEVKSYHLIRDIVSICLVVPLKDVLKQKLFFNEKLGLGNSISQGEESLFIYNLHERGVKIYYDTHLIYHPYKRNFNIKNFYSMSYFWSMGLFNISHIFMWPAIKYLGKYTVALLFSIKERRYWSIFKNVWKGFFDGASDKSGILRDGYK